MIPAPPPLPPDAEGPSVGGSGPSRAWRSFRRWPAWIQVVAWILAWPFLGALYFWQSDLRGGHAIAVAILLAGLATYGAFGSSGRSRAPRAAPTISSASPQPTVVESPTKTPTEDLGDAPIATPTATLPPRSSACRTGDPLANVYHPDRLTIIRPCTTVTGVIKTVRREEDGDYHIDLLLDPPYAGLINEKNRTDQHGYLVTEIVPADEPGCEPGEPPKPATGSYDYGVCTGADIPPPPLGAHVSMTGPYVLDTAHGWMEIHPVWRVVILDSTATSGGTTKATSLRIVSISPDPVNPGQNITLTAQTSARASCGITVTYASGHVSTASGLESKTANSSGRVSWTWKVGTRTGAGTATGRVSCGGRTAEKTFSVS